MWFADLEASHIFLKGGENMEKKSVINLNKIRGLRAEHNETQKDIADILGIHISSYQSKEWGISEFKPSELKTLADRWGVDISDLFC
jgi:putative transcriptional regulator